MGVKWDILGLTVQQTRAGCKSKRDRNKYSFVNYLQSWEGSSLHERKNGANSEEDERNSWKKLPSKPTLWLMQRFLEPQITTVR